MKFLLRGLGWLGCLACLPAAWCQFTPAPAGTIAKVEIRHVGPPAVSDEFIRSNIRVKPGDPYQLMAVDEDVRNLYASGFFYNIRIAETNAGAGIILTYVLQGNPRIREILIHGNSRLSESKIRKKITSKAGEPFNEPKLFSDVQEIKKLYQKAGCPATEITYVPSIDESAGRATVTFEIVESPKIKIVQVDFVGAHAFSQKALRKKVKTRKHWMWSWITTHGFLKDEDLELDKETLAEFYRDHGYIDFELKDVKYEHPTPRSMIVQFIIYEGTQYRVGAVSFSGNKLFSTNEISEGIRRLKGAGNYTGPLGPHGLAMDVGDVFTPRGYETNIDQIEDFYGSKGYIDVTKFSARLNVVRVPNTEKGTMDLEFQIDEGQKSYIEKIDIKGNNKTKDTVIRRELAVYPGEVFDMVRVKVSKTRLEGLQSFDKVDARPEPTDIQNHKNLVIGVEEKNTGNFTLGAGFSSVDSVVGFAEVSQANFDLFNPPTFTGGGQKFRLRVSLGLELQDYVATFIEPYFLGKRLALSVELFYRELDYQSLNNEYNEVHAGGKVSLTPNLWNQHLIGSVNYSLEDIGILLNPGFNNVEYLPAVRGPSRNPGGPFGGPSGPSGIPGAPPIYIPVGVIPANVPQDILDQVGYHLQSSIGGSLAYDTRGGGALPNKGQRTELDASFYGGPLGGDEEFYKLELHTGWYLRGFFKGDVLEIGGQGGFAKSIQSGNVPFYDRYYLGGLYSLRGYHYRSISPRQPGLVPDEPIGGDSYWFGSAEYSFPIFEQPHGIGVRFAFFYDIGNVLSDPYDFSLKGLDDDYGFGLRLNLPIGPLRLDYGIPIHHDQYNSGSGKFQFGVGYTREF